MAFRRNPENSTRFVYVPSPPGRSSVAHVSAKQNSQNFFLPVECNEVIFLRTRLCILHQNGFSLIKLPEYDTNRSPLRIATSAHGLFTRMASADVPQAGDQNVSECKKLIKRCSSGRPLSMTRVETEVFILCYDSEHPRFERSGEYTSHIN